MEKLRTWHEFLIEQLTDREEAIGYLQVSLEEYLIDGDTPFFLKGIRNVIEAQGGVKKSPNKLTSLRKPLGISIQWKRTAA